MTRKREEKTENIAILHNIRSCYNVGSIFRTADALGISKIFLGGYTPDPDANRSVAKTALGAEKSVSWEKVWHTHKLIDKLKKQKYQIVAIEQSDDSVDLQKFKPSFPCAFIVGNEVKGLSEKMLEKTDKKVEIPMKGKKESLNVSVAFGIAVYKILNS